MSDPKEDEIVAPDDEELTAEQKENKLKKKHQAERTQRVKNHKEDEFQLHKLKRSVINNTNIDSINKSQREICDLRAQLLYKVLQARLDSNTKGEHYHDDKYEPTFIPYDGSLFTQVELVHHINDPMLIKLRDTRYADIAEYQRPMQYQCDFKLHEIKADMVSKREFLLYLIEKQFPSLLNYDYFKVINGSPKDNRQCKEMSGIYNESLVYLWAILQSDITRISLGLEGENNIIPIDHCVLPDGSNFTGHFSVEFVDTHNIIEATDGSENFCFVDQTKHFLGEIVRELSNMVIDINIKGKITYPNYNMESKRIHLSHGIHVVPSSNFFHETILINEDDQIQYGIIPKKHHFQTPCAFSELHSMVLAGNLFKRNYKLSAHDLDDDFKPATNDWHSYWEQKKLLFEFYSKYNLLYVHITVRPKDVKLSMLVRYTGIPPFIPSKDRQPGVVNYNDRYENETYDSGDISYPDYDLNDSDESDDQEESDEAEEYEESDEAEEEEEPDEPYEQPIAVKIPMKLRTYVRELKQDKLYVNRYTRDTDLVFMNRLAAYPIVQHKQSHNYVDPDHYEEDDDEYQNYIGETWENCRELFFSAGKKITISLDEARMKHAQNKIHHNCYVLKPYIDLAAGTNKGEMRHYLRCFPFMQTFWHTLWATSINRIIKLFNKHETIVFTHEQRACQHVNDLCFWYRDISVYANIVDEEFLRAVSGLPDLPERQKMNSKTLYEFNYGPEKQHGLSVKREIVACKMIYDCLTVENKSLFKGICGGLINSIIYANPYISPYFFFYVIKQIVGRIQTSGGQYEQLGWVDNELINIYNDGKNAKDYPELLNISHSSHVQYKNIYFIRHFIPKYTMFRFPMRDRCFVDDRIPATGNVTGKFLIKGMSIANPGEPPNIFGYAKNNGVLMPDDDQYTEEFTHNHKDDKIRFMNASLLRTNTDNWIHMDVLENLEHIRDMSIDA